MLLLEQVERVDPLRAVAGGALRLLAPAAAAPAFALGLARFAIAIAIAVAIAMDQLREAAVLAVLVQERKVVRFECVEERITKSSPATSRRCSRDSRCAGAPDRAASPSPLRGPGNRRVPRPSCG